MKKRKYPLTAECLSVSMPTPLATALAKAAEARATSMSSYVRGALFDRLARDGIELVACDLVTAVSLCRRWCHERSVVSGRQRPCAGRKVWKR